MVGGWWLVIGGWQWLAVVRGWRLAVGGGWRLVGGWWLAVGGPWGRSLARKKKGSLKTALPLVDLSCVTQPPNHSTTEHICKERKDDARGQGGLTRPRLDSGNPMAAQCEGGSVPQAAGGDPSLCRRPPAAVIVELVDVGLKTWWPGQGGGWSQISNPAALLNTSTYASGRVVLTLLEASGCDPSLCHRLPDASKTLAGVSLNSGSDTTIQHFL